MHKSDVNEFVYKDIFPVRIVAAKGNIIDSENLLKEKHLQITTNEESFTTLKNDKISKNSFIVLDFGKEIHGKLRILTFTEDSNKPVNLRITYGESVAEAMSDIGYKGATNDHSTRDFVFSFPQYSDISLNESGFRFAKIELKDKNTSINIKAVTAVSIIRDIPYLGSFRCNNELINKIYDTCAYTCHLNMQKYIWDGIKRDRLVWVGDMHPEMLTVRTVFGAHRIIDDSINFMRETTLQDQWMNGMPTYSLWWIHILYDWYLYSGNYALLEANREYALKLIERISNLVNSDGSDNLPSYFLDWPCNNKPAGKTGSLALLAISLESASNLAKILNNESLAELCYEKRKKLLSTTPETFGAKQVAAIYSLAGWMDEKQAGREILDEGAKGWSTFMSYYLLKAASKTDMNKTLDALCEYYGGMLKMGATTFWEDFNLDWLENASPIDSPVPKNNSDLHGDNGDFCYKGYRHSLCHGWASGPAAFLAEEVLGIRILEPGCEKILIKPNLGNLEYAKGTYPTPYGIISIECRKINGLVEFTYSAPEKIKIITEKGEI